MKSGERLVRALFGVLISVSLLVAGSLESRQDKRINTAPLMPPRSSSSTSTEGGRLKGVKKVIGIDKLHVHPNSDLNFVSKRRVPNGPDPIHNRRTGNSGRPPGQA